MNTASAVATVARTSTTVFFLKALELLQPDIIADIGSRNGREARLFRSAAPKARIVAYEANPALVARMESDDELRTAQVEVVHCAASNEDGTAVLYITDREVFNGSLRPWVARETLDTVQVPTRRLERLLTALPDQTVALWIDVEGCAFEVLEGAGRLLDHVVAVHVEVEAVERWRGARLMGDVQRLLDRRGFRAVYTVMDSTTGQGDVVFLRQGAPVTDTQLSSKLARHAVYRLLADLVNGVRLADRAPRCYAVLRRTVGGYLKR